jgi:hypothetical protein
MGICLAMVRLSDAAIDEICATPKKALHFWMQDEAPEAEPVGWFGRLLGKKDSGSPKCSVSREPEDETDLDKAWEAMDYLLSEGRRNEGTARFLTEGGVEVPEEIGYGPPRVIRSAEVKKIDAFLRGVKPESLRAHYVPQAMDREKIYPQIWARDGDEGFEYIFSFFEPLRSFISDAAQRGVGIMIVYT